MYIYIYMYIYMCVYIYVPKVAGSLGHDEIEPREENIPAKVLWLRLWGLGFRVWGFGFRISGLGFKLWGLGLSEVRLE